MAAKNNAKKESIPSYLQLALRELFGDIEGPPSHKQLEISMPVVADALWRDLSFHPAYDFLTEMVAEKKKRKQEDKKNGG